MGNTDWKLIPFYKKHIIPNGGVALLGSVNNTMFNGDCYDMALSNWDINKEWNLKKKYDTLICTRCSYFCKDLSVFFSGAFNNLNEGGLLYVDVGLGDHYRFADFKVGWVKNGEHEWGHFAENYLWSTIWDDSFLYNKEYKRFSELIVKYGYDDLKKAVYEECPYVLSVKDIHRFDILEYNVFVNDSPTLLHNLFCLRKKRTNE